MAKKDSKSYFSHDSNARNNAKLLNVRMRHGAAGYGIYFMILERMRENKNYMCVKDYNMIAFDLRVASDVVKSIVEEFGLFTFTDDGKCFYSESFTRRMNVMQDSRSKRSAAGKKGGAPVGNDNARKKELPKAAPAPTPQPATTAQPADNKACIKLFFAKQNDSNLDVLMMNFGLKPNDITMIQKVAKEIVAEWEISKKEHTDYTDWSKHLIATMRIKIKDKQHVTEPPSTADYQYDGGFGSKDV